MSEKGLREMDAQAAEEEEAGINSISVKMVSDKELKLTRKGSR